jgi:hypothetical protein
MIVLEKQSPGHRATRACNIGSNWTRRRSDRLSALCMRGTTSTESLNRRVDANWVQETPVFDCRRAGQATGWGSTLGLNKVPTSRRAPDSVGAMKVSRVLLYTQSSTESLSMVAHRSRRSLQASQVSRNLLGSSSDRIGFTSYIRACSSGNCVPFNYPLMNPNRKKSECSISGEYGR